MSDLDKVKPSFPDLLTSIDDLLRLNIQTLNMILEEIRRLRQAYQRMPTPVEQGIVNIRYWWEGYPPFYRDSPLTAVSPGDTVTLISYTVEKSEKIIITQIGLKLEPDMEAWLEVDGKQVFPEGDNVSITDAWAVFNLSSTIEAMQYKTITLKVKNNNTTTTRYAQAFLSGVRISD